MTDWIDIGLWIVQALLAVVFLLAGGMHAFRSERARKNMTVLRDIPHGAVVFGGVMELAGAVGIVIPRLLNILPWLTPYAATGLATIMLIASGLHLRRKEYSAMGMTGILVVLAIVVAYGRWLLVP